MKRTSLNLDLGLATEARGILGTSNTTDTVHAALREVVRRERLRSLSEWDLNGMTLEDLAETRRGGTFDDEFFARQRGET